MFGVRPRVLVRFEVRPRKLQREVLVLLSDRHRGSRFVGALERYDGVGDGSGVREGEFAERDRVADCAQASPKISRER